MFYNKSVEELFKHFEVSEEGLSKEEAALRLKKYGKNLITQEDKSSLLFLFFHQMKDPLVYILLIAALFTILIHHYVDTMVIILVVLINTIIGFIQEYKAEKAMQAIKKLASPKAIVVRDGKEKRIDSQDLVQGDIIVLTAGNKIPADIRIFSTKELEIDESMLTGESISILKVTNPIDSKNLPSAEQKNMAFMGTVVTQGKGKGLVVATGEHTELGKISKEVKTTQKDLTPLQKKLAVFSKYVGIITIVLSVIVVAIGLFKKIPLDEIVLFSISMIVSVIPEGLPVVITITMALGINQMARKKAIVRKLIAVETLGSCNYICSDKTGTITENQMTVTNAFANNKIYSFSGSGYSPEGSVYNNKVEVNNDNDLHQLLITGVLCNSTDLFQENGDWKIDGDPTEAALIVSAMKYGINPEFCRDEYELIDEIPFNSVRQFMSSLFKHKDGYYILVKGSPEKILKFSNLSDNQAIKDEYTKFADSGLRVLGFGFKYLPDNIKPNLLDLEAESVKNLTFSGFQCIIDPPKESVTEAVENTASSNIHTIMLTGDHKITASAIAKQIGLLKPGKIVMTGADIDNNEDDYLEKNIDNVQVFARVSPHHKLKIVSLLQKKNNIVAVTGDGINDAPALKKANIGVAMGKAGTDVAKEAADIILKDDNFSSIYDAVIVGRTIYDNIQKVIFFLLGTACGMSLVILLSLLLNLPLPFLATQVLWINLVTNGIQDVALAYEPGEKLLKYAVPRSPKENIMNDFLLKRLVIVGLVIGLGTLLVFWLMLNQEKSLLYARTAAMNTMVFFQLFQVWNARSFNVSVFKLNVFSNPFLLISLFVSLFAEILVLNLPAFQYIFHTTELDANTWGINILVASSVIFFVEIDKFIRNAK